MPNARQPSGEPADDEPNPANRSGSLVGQDMQERVDAHLVTGDRERFALLFDRYAATLHNYCARRVGVDLAQDVVADTFLIAFEKRQRFDAACESALPWLYGIATNVLRRHRRTEVRALRALMRTGVDPLGGGNAFAVDDSSDIAARLDALSVSRRLARALAGMCARNRDALLLFAWGDLSYAEIADALHISVGTVRSRLNRARTQLRAELADLSENEGVHQS